MQPAAYKAAVTILAKNSKVPIAPPNSPPENDIFIGLEKIEKLGINKKHFNLMLCINYLMFCLT